MLSLPHRLAACLMVALFCALLTGCGDDLPPTAPVQGIVTWNGKPVEHGTITFYPKNGRPATGQIQPDGSYTITTFRSKDGAILGNHSVTIEATATPTIEDVPKSMDEEMRRAGRGIGRGRMATTTTKWLVPREYSRWETTPLRAEVKPEQNKIDFRLLR